MYDLIIKNGKIILYTSSNEQQKTVKVPDVVGKSPIDANKLVVNSGLNISVSGAVAAKNAYAVKQYPEAGSTVPEGTVVTIEFLHMDEVIGNAD